MSLLLEATAARERGVTAPELFYIARRMANQVPTRYYLDATGTGDYSRVALELYFEDERFPDPLNNEFGKAGFEYVGCVDKPGFHVRRWEAKRCYYADVELPNDFPA